MITESIAERAHAAQLRGECLIVGICGAQGSGKSTLSRVVCRALENRGLQVAVLSLDDLYLTREERSALAKRVHPLLQTRGVPGTHDVQLGLDVLQALAQPGVTAIPSFDKALDDRRPQAEWSRVQGPVNVILFEGWCVGATPQSQDALDEPVNALERDEDRDGSWRRYVNDCLGEAYQRLYRRIGMLIFLAAPDFDVVYRWRLEQENALKKAVAGQDGGPSQVMNERQLARFISHYERLTRHILAEMPGRADLVLRLNAERMMTLEK